MSAFMGNFLVVLTDFYKNFGVDASIATKDKHNRMQVPGKALKPKVFSAQCLVFSSGAVTPIRVVNLYVEAKGLGNFE